MAEGTDSEIEILPGLSGQRGEYLKKKAEVLKKKEEKLRKKRTCIIAAAAAVAVIATVLIIADYAAGAGKKNINESGEALSTNSNAAYEAAGNGTGERQKGAFDEVLLSAEEREIIESVYESFVSGEHTAAASKIIESYEELDGIWFEKMKEQEYIYDGESLKLLKNYPEKLSGLVLAGPSTVFFGDFVNSVPEGNVFAMNAYETDADRYDYSAGSWSAGRMQGEGTTGYRYLDNSTADDVLSGIKSGEFADDAISGEVSYTAENKDGSKGVWKFNAKDGVTLLDDKWEYDKERKVYSLASVEGDYKTYELSASEKDIPKWINLINWKVY